MNTSAGNHHKTLEHNFNHDHDLNLANLLIAAGILTRSQLNSHQPLATFIGIPLGNLLVRQKTITRDLLKVAIRLQSLLADKLISQTLACLSLREIQSGTASADDVLASLSDLFPSAITPCRLGELLIDADLLNDISLGRALITSQESNQMLGEVLVKDNVLPLHIVQTALCVQKDVHAKTLSYASGVSCLSSLKNFPFSKSLNQIAS
jgi:hypothetical protein